MSKKRREEEARIIAEMEAAMKECAEQKAEEKEGEPSQPKTETTDVLKNKTPEISHCYKCKTTLENGVCPICGYKPYVPMDSEQQKKIRWIATGVCVVALVIFLIVMEIVK